MTRGSAREDEREEAGGWGQGAFSPAPPRPSPIQSIKYTQEGAARDVSKVGFTGASALQITGEGFESLSPSVMLQKLTEGEEQN